MTIKEFYLNNYPSDELGLELKEKSTFLGLLNELINNKDIYDYIGVYDSLMRERIFSELSKQLNTDYDYIYNLWLKEIILKK